MELKQGMKAKTIKSVLRRKIDAWLNSIEDEDLRRRCKRDAIVTGGCIASMLLGEKVSDFDIYFQNRRTVEDLAQYYVKKFKENKPHSPNMYVETIDDIRGESRVRVVVESVGVGIDKENEANDYTTEIYDDTSVVEELVEDTKDKLDTSNEKENYRPIFFVE